MNSIVLRDSVDEPAAVSTPSAARTTVTVNAWVGLVPVCVQDAARALKETVETRAPSMRTRRPSVLRA